MANETTVLGLVGVIPGRRWPARTHIPGLRSLPGYKIVAVGNNSLESSQATVKALDIPEAFPNAGEPMKAADVDLVSVTVNFSYDKELSDAALDAKKMVFCEWPLGNGLAEAEAMATRAKELGVWAAVGLQARCSPTVRYVRDLTREGYVGEVLPTTLVGSVVVAGASEMPEAHIYLSDRKNVVAILTIPFGHAINGLCWCLGDFREVWASLEMRRKSSPVIKTKRYHSTVADQRYRRRFADYGTARTSAAFPLAKRKSVQLISQT